MATLLLNYIPRIPSLPFSYTVDSYDLSIQVYVLWIDKLSLLQLCS